MCSDHFSSQLQKTDSKNLGSTDNSQSRFLMIDEVDMHHEQQVTCMTWLYQCRIICSYVSVLLLLCFFGKLSYLHQQTAPCWLEKGFHIVQFLCLQTKINTEMRPSFQHFTVAISRFYSVQYHIEPVETFPNSKLLHTVCDVQWLLSTPTTGT